MRARTKKPTRRRSCYGGALLGSLLAIGCGDKVYVICMPTSEDAATPLVMAAPDPQPTRPPIGTKPLDAGASPPAPEKSECPPERSRRIEVVTGEITKHTRWTCDTVYLLGGFVTVKNFATLTISPGTIVKGDATSALLITRDGRIDARGRPDQPVVFTSVAARGARAFGDWQGLVLLGRARLNVEGLERELEGLSRDNPDYRYGGTDDAHDCGTLHYVRVEFAGHELQQNKELNSLTVAGCGSKTSIDFVQLHRGKDDGVEFFGGTASAKHLVITGVDDDGIDWDEGFRGNVQFAAIQQYDLTGAGDANGIEASNRTSPLGAMPVASPTLYNLTMIGDRDAYNKVSALLLKDGTHGTIRNVIALDFATAAIDVVTKQSADALRATPADLTVSHSIFYAIGSGGTSFFPADDVAESAADDGLSEAAFFRAPELALRLDVDPLLPAPHDQLAPGWVPPPDSPAASGAATPPNDGFFDVTASYVGAFRPGGEDWTAGWTEYPEN